MIRVALLVPWLQMGGLEKLVVQLAIGLDRGRFQTEVWSAEPSGLAGDILRQHKVPIHSRPILLRNAQEARATVQWLQDQHFDILYSCFSGPVCADALVAATARIPVFLTRRDNLRYWDPAMTVTRSEQIRNANSAAVVMTSRAAGEIALKVEGLDPAKARWIPNGVELPPHRSKRVTGGSIGYAANFRAMKAFDVLLDAFQVLRRSQPDARLSLAGRADKELQSMVRRRKLDGSVDQLGELAGMTSFYRSLSIYVHPSRSESLSLSVLEAMAHGLPVVASAVGGLLEAVEDGVTGLLVPPGDPAALQRALERLSNDPALRSRMGKAGRARVRRHFRLQRMVKLHEELFEELIAQRSRQS